MLRFNNREIKPTYRTDADNKIFEVRSIYNIEELLTRLRGGQELSSDELNIRVYETEAEADKIIRKLPTNDFGYENVITSEDEDVYRNTANAIEAERPFLFNAYEKFILNNPIDGVTFKETQTTQEELMNELYDGIGIMPTIKDIPEKSVTDLIKMSSTGERLYWTFSKLSSKNRLPHKEDMEFFESLSDYEQRLINESTAHPMKLLDTIRAIRDEIPKAYLTKDTVYNIEQGNSVDNAVAKAVIPFFPNGLNAETELNNAVKITRFKVLIASGQSNIHMSEMSIPEVNNATDAIIRYFDALKNEEVPDEIVTSFPNKETAKNFITALASQFVIPDNLINDDMISRVNKNTLLPYYNFAVEKWNEFIAKNPEPRVEDMVAFAVKAYKVPQGEKMTIIENAFKEAFKGHAPRILAEYVESWCLINDKKLNELSDKNINDIVKGFNQKNIQKVAGSKNINLLALAPYINYMEIKQEYIDLLATSVQKDDLSELKKKGFIEWFKTHKDVKLSELSNMLRYVRDITKFDIDKSAKELVERVTMRQAYEDKENYERKYNFKFSDNEIAIRGRHIVATEGKLKMYMLPADDLRQFNAGRDTNCCQEWGDAGETCVWKYVTDPFAAEVVIERDGVILGQGFVWTDEVTDTFVFDNMEFKNDGKIGTYANVIAEYVKALPYKNVHVGTGYLAGGMGAWGKRIAYEAQMPKTLYEESPHRAYYHADPEKSYIYSDYHFRAGGDIARSFKTNGKMEIKNRGVVKVESKPDEPTKWDKLMHPAINFLLNDNAHSIDERLEFAEKFLNNPTPEIQMEAVKKNPAAIRYIENPTVEVQKFVVSERKSNAKYIKNPCADVQGILLHDDVHYIKNIENPSDAMAKFAVSRDGLLLEYIKDPSDEVVDLAIKQNGYAIRLLPPERQTEERQKIAVSQNAKIITLIAEPSDEVMKSAIDRDVHIVGLLPEIYNHIQLYAVHKDPSVINDIKNPTLPAIETAVRKNPLLIRNFQKRAPHLRMEAVKANGFAIRGLKDPTFEEMVEAVKTTPAAINAIPGSQLKAEIKAAIESEENNRIDTTEEQIEEERD